MVAWVVPVLRDGNGGTGGTMRYFRILLATALVGATTMLGGASAAGPPTYWCFGEVATIVGTPGDDVLIGRDNTADVIVGLGGNDSISGMTDDDYFEYTGPSQDDRLCGGPGDDGVFGSLGEDYLNGGRGDDRVDGSYSYDWIARGGPGNDRMEDCDNEYSGAALRMSGGPGHDSLCSYWFPVRMSGGRGNDLLIDLDCYSDSRLSGGRGDDHIESWNSSFKGSPCSEYGGLDADTVAGGAGEDDAVVNQGDIVTGTESIEQR
jgi:Ca2+-binding RTX toxin-like protein